MKQVFFQLLITAIFCQFSYAATITVCASNCDQTTISGAISAASPGDIIDIQDATHTEDNISINKNLTIQGQGQSTTTVQGHATKGSGDDSVFKITTTGLTVVFQNLTIKNGSAKASGSSSLEYGGGVYISCNASSDISFIQVTIEDCTAEKRGGGVYITGSDGTVSFSGCVIKGNETGTGEDGGGIVNLGADNFTLTKCTISGNVAGDDGGGVYVLEDGSVNKFINCTVYNNAAGASSGGSGTGGGFFLADGTSFNFYNCTIVDNTVTTGTSRGGGIYKTETSTLDLTNTIVANNSGATDGDDIYATNEGVFTQITSLAEDCEGTCPCFSYFGDPNLAAVATCGEQAYFPTNAQSFIADNGTAPAGDIPTDDICGTNRAVAKYDIGSYDDVTITAGSVETTTDIEAYFNTIIDCLPEAGLNNFAEPTVGNLTTWTEIIDNLLAENTATAHTSALTIGYEVVLFTDNSVTPNKLYYILQKTASGTNYWGTYVFNPAPCREIIIEAPHPIHDTNTGNQGVFCLKNTNSRAFMLSGTHRCNNNTNSSCDGTTTACSASGAAENFKISDLAHNTNNCFQITSNKLHDDIATSVLVQLHGFQQETDDPEAILSNGTTIAPSGTDYAANLKTEIEALDGTLEFKIAHSDGWTRLIGTTNTQGRYINGQASPCNNAAIAATGRFIHLEQEKISLRSNAAAWAKVSGALENMIACVALPVELTEFKAILTTQKTIELTWKTATELNNYGFEIHKSKDGKEWKSIGFVEGNGTTTNETIYHFMDFEPLNGRNYYRLEQMDFDDNIHYSTIINIDFQALDPKCHIFPNPVQDILYIVNGKGAATIYNVLGQPIKKWEINDETATINTNNLPSGQYILQIKTANNERIVRRFVR